MEMSSYFAGNYSIWQPMEKTIGFTFCILSIKFFQNNMKSKTDYLNSSYDDYLKWFKIKVKTQNIFNDYSPNTDNTLCVLLQKWANGLKI